MLQKNPVVDDLGDVADPHKPHVGYHFAFAVVGDGDLAVAALVVVVVDDDLVQIHPEHTDDFGKTAADTPAADVEPADAAVAAARRNSSERNRSRMTPADRHAGGGTSWVPAHTNWAPAARFRHRRVALWLNPSAPPQENNANSAGFLRKSAREVAEADPPTMPGRDDFSRKVLVWFSRGASMVLNGSELWFTGLRVIERKRPVQVGFRCLRKLVQHI